MRHFNEHHLPARIFEVGDLVVVRNVDISPGGNKKLIPKYRRPYVVRKQLGNDRYEISDCQITQIPYKGVVDSSHLKKWVERNNCSSMGDPNDDYGALEEELL